MGLKRTDDPNRRRLALMRKADTMAQDDHTISGVKRRIGHVRKPSMPKMPWEDPSPTEDER